MQNVNNKNLEKKWKAIVFLLIGIGLFIGANFIASIYSTTQHEALFLSLALVLFGVVAWFVLTLVLWWVFTNKESTMQSKQKQILQKYVGQVLLCEKEDRICCLSKALSIPGLNLRISPERKESYRLYYVSELEEIEDCITGRHNWTDIWIFSEDLSTEVCGDDNQLEAIPVRNINSGVRYSEFYLTEDFENSGRSSSQMIQSRIKGMKASVKNSQNISFYGLSTRHGYIGRNTLPLLCGSILFSSECTSDGEPLFSDGYLSLRMKMGETPIYYKMPQCMLMEYAEYFKNIKIQKNKGDH